MAEQHTAGARTADDAGATDPLPFPALSALAEALRDGSDSSVGLTRRCLDRIAALDPKVNAVVALDGTALDQAAAADARTAAGTARGPLDGIPILVKDNIDTAGLATSVGSRLLAGAVPARDADVVAALREHGAVVLGKTNLSEWANFRSTHSTEGWSGAGGQTRNPHALDRSPWGSSAGSAAAVAAGMAPLALGTETDGSIVGPAGVCGVVGVKPEPGLLSGRGVAPLLPAQDSVGLLSVRLADAALAAAALTGRPELEPRPAAVPGLRLGLWRLPGLPRAAAAVVDRAVETLRRAGAVVVPVEFAFEGAWGTASGMAAVATFRDTLGRYLADRGAGPGQGTPGTLAELVEGNTREGLGLDAFDQDLLELALAATTDQQGPAQSDLEAAVAAARALIDDTLARYGVSALLAASNEPAWPIDYELGDPFPVTSSNAAAIARYPNISIPIGASGELPIGISVFGPARLAGLLPPALAVESACGTVRQPALTRNRKPVAVG